MKRGRSGISGEIELVRSIRLRKHVLLGREGEGAVTSSAALAEVEGERTTFLISVDNLAQRPKYIGRTLYFNKMQLKQRHEEGGGG